MSSVPSKLSAPITAEQFAAMTDLDEPVRACSAAEEIAFAPVLPDWRVRVKQFFEAR